VTFDGVLTLLSTLSTLVPARHWNNGGPIGARVMTTYKKAGRHVISNRLKFAHIRKKIFFRYIQNSMHQKTTNTAKPCSTG
jgi:hypothetical protein